MINASLGYGLGFALASLLMPCVSFVGMRWRRIQPTLTSPMSGFTSPRKHINDWIVGGGLIGYVGFVIYHYQLSRQIAVQMDALLPTLLTTLASAVLSILGWWTIVIVARFIFHAIVSFTDMLVQRMPSAVKWLVRVTVMLGIIAMVLIFSRDYIWHKLVEKVAYHAMTLDQSDPDNLSAPTSPYKSGFVSHDANLPKPAQQWHELGHYGQRFVSLGLSQADIEAVTNQPSKEPIRVFAGLNHQEPNQSLLDQTISIALAEMERTDAFSRRYIVIQGATGRGWIEEYSSQAVEYLTYGDVATIAIQYSYLPSQFSFLLDDDAATYANQRLINAIEAKLNSLPVGSRPKLLLAGESLGAYASQSPFTEQQDLLDRIDGAVWVGTPRFSPLWQSLVAHRDVGSTEVLPIISEGKHIRFMDSPQTLNLTDRQNQALEWNDPRIVFIQYATDPIVWWDTSLIKERPDWLIEPKGRGVTHQPTWLPLLTFWELSLDMPASDNTPAGFGHIYEDDIVYAWAKVLDNDQLAPAVIAEHIEHRLATLKHGKDE